MATRRKVFINKIKTGSKFRTLGITTGGGTKKKSKGIQLPKFTITVTVDPTFAKFLPLSPEWQELQKAYLGNSVASPQDYIDSTKRFSESIKGTKFTDFMTFMFDETIFDDDFYKQLDLPFNPYGSFIKSPVK